MIRSLSFLIVATTLALAARLLAATPALAQPLTSPPPASADGQAPSPDTDADVTPPSQTQDEDFEQLIQRALASHAAGDLDAALSLMGRAHALRPSARTWRGLGVIQFARGDVRSAIPSLQASLRSERHPLTPALRVSVEKLLDRCWAQLSRVHVHVVPEGADLAVDGKPARYDRPGEVWLDPGAHQLRLQADGFLPRRLGIEAEPGSVHHVHVELTPDLAQDGIAAPDVAGMEAAHKSKAPPDGRSTRIVWTLYGLGGAAAMAGLTSWSVARVRFGNLKDDCGSNPCDRDDVRSQWNERRIGTLANAGIAIMIGGVSAALAGGSLQLWAWRKHAQEGALAMGPSGFTLTIHH